MKGKKIKVLICGLGSIGRRHAGILLGLGCEVYALRSGGTPGMDGVIEVRDWNAAMGISPDAMFVCTPTHDHIDAAIAGAACGIPLFIEKPIDCSTARLDELLFLVRIKRLTTYVAYPFRHHEDILRLKKDISRVKVISAHVMCLTDIKLWGKEYSKKAETGGGAILELSHEIDLAEFLMGPIVEMRGKKQHSGYFTDAETSVFISAIHASGKESHISLAIDSDVESRCIAIETDGAHLITDLLGKEKLDAAYVAQVEYFLRNLGNENMDNNLKQAVRLFDLVMDFRGGVEP